VGTPRNFGAPCDCGGTVGCDGSCPADCGGLVAWYPFDGDVKDASGNALHGTNSGATLHTDRHGQNNRAYAFDGVDDAVVVPDNALLDLTEFSLALFINIEDNSEDGIVLSKGPRFGNYTLRVTASDADSWPGYLSYVNDVATGNYSSLVSNSAIPVATWVHVAVTRSDAQLRTYIDGVLARSVNSPGSTPVMTTEPLQIGAGQYGQFAGAIDEVRIYDRVLSAAEVTALSEL
jgi:hypothetical protein